MRLTLTALLVFAFTAVSVFAADPKQAEMMQKWMAYATPGEPHALFKDMAGNWKYTMKWWEKEGGPAQESKGTSKIKIIMGGRFLQQEVKGKSMGMPLEGMGFLGYDNVTKKYNSIWFDNMGTGMMKGEGTFDKATQTLTDKGEFSCPMREDTEDYVTEWKIVDKKTMTFSMTAKGPDGGKAYKQMEMTFTK